VAQVKDPKFKDYKDWYQRHLTECPHVVRDEQRSSLSRMFLCEWALVPHRCMFRLCRLVKR